MPHDRLSLTRNPDQLPRELLEEYEPEGQDPVGEGAFAIVRLARHRRTGELFALKCVEKYPLEIRNMLGQMHREVRIHQNLRHPNILQLVRVFDDEAYVFMLLEYCERGNLRMLVESSPGYRLPEPQSAYYFEQIARGVDCMHRRSCVHRDLKLENMLLTARDELKICDFGWSATVEGDHLLRTVCGTTTYWAPEIWEGAAQNEGVDMWALGCLLYEMLAGHPPFSAVEKDELCKRVLQVHFAYPAWFSNEVRNLVQGLLQRDPHQRTRCADLLRHPWLLVKNQRQVPNQRQPRATEPPPALPPPPPPLLTRDQARPAEEDSQVPMPPPPPPPRHSRGQPHPQPAGALGRQSMVLPAPRVLQDGRGAPVSSPAATGLEMVRAPRGSLAASGRVGPQAAAERKIAWDLPTATPMGGGGSASPRLPSFEEASRESAGPLLRGGRSSIANSAMRAQEGNSTCAGAGRSSRSPALRSSNVGSRPSVASPNRSRPVPAPPPRAGEPFSSPRHMSPGPEVGRRHTHAHSVSPMHHCPWVTSSAVRAQSEAPSAASGHAQRSGSSVMQAAAAPSPPAARLPAPASGSFGPLHLQAGLPTTLRMQIPSTQSFPSQVFSSVAPLGSVLVPSSKSQSFSLQSPKGSFFQPTVMTTGALPRSPAPQRAGPAPRSPRSMHGQQVNAPPPQQLQRNGSGSLTSAPQAVRSTTRTSAPAVASTQFRPWGF